MFVQQDQRMISLKNSEKKNIDDLPDEILEYILSLVSPYKDLDSCKVVSKRWFRTIKSVSQHSKCDLLRSVLSSSVIWQQIAPSSTSSTISERYSHSACYSESFMYVFGGSALENTTFNDLWTLDLTKRQWIRPVTTGCYPSPKASATLCCYNKTLILFGGWTYPPPYPLHQTRILFNELHIFDLTSIRWSAVHFTLSPPPMAAHSASIHVNLMVVFGGCRFGGLFSSSNDVWCLNLDTQTWSKPETTDPKPEPRYGQSQIYLNDKNILIIGGCGGPNLIFDDVWLLTITDSVWVWKKIKVHNNHWAAPHIWCHPCSRVGDAVVIFSRASPEALSHYASTVCTSPTSPDSSNPSKVISKEASQKFQNRTKNSEQSTSGRPNRVATNASLTNNTSNEGPSSSSEASTSRKFINERSREPIPHCSHSCRLNGDFQMAAFRDESTCPKHGNSKNRLKQLESLRRLEARYKNPTKDANVKPKRNDDPSDPPQNLYNGSAANKMNMYVADISKVLCENGFVSWRPPRSHSSGPRVTMLHSVVLGKGELIIFGGIYEEPSAMTFSMPSHKAGSNTLYFVAAPRKIV